MADGNGNGRVTAPGVVLGGMLLIVVVISVWLFVSDRYWFPSVASAHGPALDGLFMAVLIVTGIAFIAVQGLMAYFVFRFGENGDERASHWHENAKVEGSLIAITAVTLTVLVFLGQSVWASIYFSEPPDDAMIVEVTGQQFQWVFHYPGPDGVFGRKDVNMFTETNYIGLDRSDPAAVDDIVTLNQMHIVLNRAIRLRLHSTDVIHSFHLPNQRIKQDTVPGMSIEVWFVPTVAGQFEIACAELCGLAHYRMKGFLTVDETEDQFQQWLDEQLEFQAADD